MPDLPGEVQKKTGTKKFRALGKSKPKVDKARLIFCALFCLRRSTKVDKYSVFGFSLSFSGLQTEFFAKF